MGPAAGLARRVMWDRPLKIPWGGHHTRCNAVLPGSIISSHCRLKSGAAAKRQNQRRSSQARPSKTQNNSSESTRQGGLPERHHDRSDRTPIDLAKREKELAAERKALRYHSHFSNRVQNGFDLAAQPDRSALEKLECSIGFRIDNPCSLHDPLSQTRLLFLGRRLVMMALSDELFKHPGWPGPRWLTDRLVELQRPETIDQIALGINATAPVLHDPRRPRDALYVVLGSIAVSGRIPQAKKLAVDLWKDKINTVVKASTGRSSIGTELLSKIQLNKSRRLPTDIEMASKLVGHKFRKTEFLRLATQPEVNQRLEFLGDRVLSYIIAEYLYLNFDWDGTTLYKELLVLVNNSTVSRIAEENGLPELQFGRRQRYSARYSNEKIASDFTDCDIIEALIAAVYQDGGIGAARRSILLLWRSKLDKL